MKLSNDGKPRTPTHLYKPTTLEAKALAFLGGPYLVSRQHLLDAHAEAADDAQRRAIYVQGHNLYHDAVTLARKRSDCPMDIAMPWNEPMKAGK